MSKKIIILVPVWGRPEIFKIFIRQIGKFIAKSKHDYHVFFIFSPEDNYLDELNGMLISENTDYVYYRSFFSNDNLGAKMNAAIDDIKRMPTNYDYLMNIGSDDLVHQSLNELYDDHIDSGNPFFGLRAIFFYNMINGKALFFNSFGKYMAGAGRMIRFDIVNKISKLYTDNLNRGLDSDSEMWLNGLGYYPEYIYADFPYIVDIKSYVNIHSFESLPGEEINPDIIHENFDFEKVNVNLKGYGIKKL